MRVIVRFYTRGPNRRRDRGLNCRAAVVHLDCCDEIRRHFGDRDHLARRDGHWQRYKTEDEARDRALSHGRARGLSEEYVTLDPGCCP